MALVELVDVDFNYSDKELYRSLSLKINDGEHCVLVGVNGSGKTTILDLLTKKLTPDRGKVVWTPHVTFSYLDQNLKIDQDLLTREYLHQTYASLFLKEAEMEKYYELSATDLVNYERHLLKAQKLQDELMQVGFYSIKETIDKLIDGLGIKQDRLDISLSKLSSGQREKVYLARMLLENKDVLFLDEPTNFLDESQVDWLANYLINYPKAFLVVSHDQSFLRKIATVVFSLENKTIVRYRGSYDHFLEQNALDKKMYEKRYIAQQRYIKNEEDFIQKHIVRATSSKAAKSRRTRLEHLNRLETPAKEEGVVHFSFPSLKATGKETLVVDNLEIGYDNKSLLDPISFHLLRNEKIAIIGKNGVGKTTFLKTILGFLKPIAGSYEWFEKTVINFYSQEAKLDLNLSPFELIKENYPSLTNTEIRTLLGSFGLRKELAMRKMKELSGGEITKARLALMSLKKSNFLIFDEPTNHLDIKAKEALFKAIDIFDGGVIIVSHEKDFYDGLVDYEIHF